MSWVGDNPMSPTRQQSLESLALTEVRVEFITLANLGEWILPSYPLHPAWEHLSAISRGDYLRAYLMHHHGGGYSDLKPTSESWLSSFAELRSGKYLGVGFQERHRSLVAQFDLNISPPRVAVLRRNWWRWRWLQVNYRSLIGNQAYIFLPGTSFTAEWLGEVERQLDQNLDALRRFPALDPRDRQGRTYDGQTSRYPLSWAHLHGDIFHPLVYRYRRKISQILPAPSFSDYK